MLIYRKGYEGTEIIEKEWFEESIFSRQYRSALKTIGRFLETSDRRDDGGVVPHTICFCGERGEGKSSCMRTVAEILRSSGKKAEMMFGNLSINHAAEKYLDSLGLQKVKDTSFFTLDILDPSYFDENHNILELVVGEIYKTIRKKAESDGNSLDRVAYNNLIKAAERVKESLFYIHRDNEKSYSEITQLNLLAASVELKDSIRHLISSFLDFVGADRLLLEVDDLDMNMAGTYEMCEQIRNYLSSPECIILMAAKYDQLEYAIALRMHRLATSSNQKDERAYFNDLAKKYLLKFLPVQIRIYMPKLYESIINQPLRVKNANQLTVENYSSIKDAVVRLIFRKTRYLFYNSRGGVSLIIPDNLRQLVSLLNLLYGMEEINDSNMPQEDFLQNQEVFKNYFFYTWSSQLPREYTGAILKWVDDTPLSQMNKSVANWLAENFKNEIERTYGDNIEEDDGSLDYEKAVKSNISSIINSNNFSYNVSTGDVFYLLSLLSLDYIDPNKEKMLFFIRSYYSILLFEQYDIVTSDVEHPGDNKRNVDSTGIFFKKDSQFAAANDLQRILNGGYFNYVPGELIPTDTTKTFHFDTRVIKGAISSKEKQSNPQSFALTDLLKECQDIINICNSPESHYSPTELEKDKIRLAEFFILMISRSIRNSDINDFYAGMSEYRRESNPASLGDFNSSTGYYVFDILAPFYNLTNPRFCYERYSKICDGLYEFAINHEFSLLRELLNVASLHRPNINTESTSGKIHALMSDAVIRNGEILTAIFENAKHRRFEIHWLKGLKMVCNLYDNIGKSNMYTYERNYTKDDTYHVEFNFLEPLSKFISSISSPKDNEEEILNKFNSIFDSVENDLLNKKRKSIEKQQVTNNDGTSHTQVETDRKKQQLLKKLKWIFGDKTIGRNDKVINGIRKYVPGNILDEKKASEILPATKKSKYVNYNADKIIDVLSQPHLNKTLDLWFNIFNIE